MNKINIKTEKVIDSFEWDRIVQDVYKRPYCFQQQEGCRDRGYYRFKVPSETYDYEALTVPENVNDPEMGVSFKSWLTRDPKQKLSNIDNQEDYCLKLWWKRNFYPDFQMIANDLYSKEILESGEYVVNIDW